MNLRSLEHFIRVAEFGSINRAAKELGLTQPALTRSIASVERDIGQRVFTRQRKGVQLTDAGRLLYAHAGKLLRQAAELRNDLLNDAPARLVLGMPTPFRHLITIPLIAEMRRIAPNINMRVFEGLNTQTRDLLLQGLLDVAILVEGQVPAADFEEVGYIREPMILFRSVKLPKPPDPISAEEVARYSLAMPGRPNPFRLGLQRMLEERRLKFPPMIEAESLDLCQDLIKAGLVDQSVGAGYLVPRPQPDIWCSRIDGAKVTWAITVRRQRSHLTEVKRVRTALSTVLANAVKQGVWPGVELLGADSQQVQKKKKGRDR
ncbi:MAG: LysR family transcriptional regulator [Xanthobacteraceae bacterium]|nr:LysR family transcriptional regulator [Xanthobacteraceae bacterium]